MNRDKVYETPTIEVTRFEMNTGIMANSAMGEGGTGWDGDKETQTGYYESGTETIDIPWN